MTVTVDTNGRLLIASITSAEIADSAAVLESLYIRWRWVKHLFGDSAYDR